MTSTTELIARLRQARAETVRRFAPIETGRLTDPREWRGAMSELRFRLAWLAEGDEGRRVRIVTTLAEAGLPLSAVHQALVLAGEARGRLTGALIGLPDAAFDLPPGNGEWTVRQTLGHAVATDLRYAIAVDYAVERERSGSGGPLRPPDSTLPTRDGAAQAGGSPSELLARLESVRDDVTLRFAAIPDNLLGAPTNWVSWDLDVRFRLHRFAAHDREHTIQLRKIVRAIGFAQTEPQLLLADASAARGALVSLLAVTPKRALTINSVGGESIQAIALAAIEDEPDL